MKQINGFIKILMILILILITIAIVVFAYFIFTEQKNQEIWLNRIRQAEQKPFSKPSDELPYGEEIITANNFFYAQLDDTAKILYKGLQTYEEEMKTGTYVISFGYEFNELLAQENGTEKLNKSFQSAWNAYRFDHMEVFYIDVEKLFLFTKKTTVRGKSNYEVTLGPKEGTNYLLENYPNKEAVDRAKTQLEQTVNEVIVSTTGSSKEKIKRIHNWMINEIHYAEEGNKNVNSYDVYGGMIEKNAVCEGYARTFKLLMDYLEIPCLLTVGTATNSNGETESHAWNIVDLDGQWYAIDVTWDDPVVIGNGTLEDERKYLYFLKGEEEFSGTHKPSGVLSENSMEFSYPELSKENYVI